MKDHPVDLGVILELMQTGVVIADQFGCITQCNPAAAEILGLQRNDITGKTSMDPTWRCVHEHRPMPRFRDATVAPVWAWLLPNGWWN
jgi:PAS domain-containing protein